jgi:integrase
MLALAGARARQHCVARKELAQFAKLYVDNIGLDDVKRAVTPLADRGLVASARQTQSRIQTVLNYAVEHGWRPEDRRSAWSAVAKRPKGERPHHPMLPWKEAPGVVAALRESDGLAARVLEYVILTATRLSEGREVRRSSEIDLATKTWTVSGSRTKSRQPHVVPLSDRALEIIAECDSHRVSDLLFFGHRDRRPVSRSGLGAMPAVDRRTRVGAWLAREFSQLVRRHRGGVRAGRERVGACIRGRHRSLPKVWACRATPPADAGMGRFS